MQFKRTGYDALIVRGKAETPVLIEITGEGVDIKDASHLWGKGVFETTEELGQNRNKRNVLCIGPAGENLVRIAAIMNDKERALARGGPGAPRDPEQQTLAMASTDGSGWEVMMLAYSMGNFRSDRELLPAMRANGIGSLLMFVVRNIFSQLPEHFLVQPHVHLR